MSYLDTYTNRSILSPDCFRRFTAGAQGSAQIMISHRSGVDVTLV